MMILRKGFMGCKKKCGLTGKTGILQVLTILCVLLTGCGNTDPELIYIRDDKLAAVEREPEFEEIQVNSIGIYVDATPSIEGYLGWHKESTNEEYPSATEEQEEDYHTLVPMTVYRRCLKQINDIIHSNFMTDDIRYYSADTTLWSTKRNVLIEAEEAGFYRNSGYKNKINGNEDENDYQMVEAYKDKFDLAYSNPSISFAIENAAEEDFAIIITDLYENQSNSDKLIASLKRVKAEKGDGTSIALLGIKSEYAGRVYDIVGMPNQNYGTVDATEAVTSESIKYRPFYMIVIGQQGAVELFVNELYQNIDTSEIQIEKAVFNESRVYGIDYQDFEEFRTSNYLYMSESELDIYSNGKMIDKKILMEAECGQLRDSEKIYLFYDISTDTLQSYLEMKSGMQKKPITIDEDVELEGLLITDWLVEDQQLCLYSVSDETFLDENIEKAMEVSALYWLKESNQILIECDIYKKNLDDGIYKYTGKIGCRPDGTEEIWIQKWNSSSAGFEGDKTQNLRNYYNAVSNMYTEEEKNIVCFTVYIDMKGK